jgi:hypothetical protein
MAELTRRIGVERMRKSSQRRRETPVTSVDLEQRVAILEAGLAKLKAELGTASGKQFPWWKEIAGIFADDPAFDEAVRGEHSQFISDSPCLSPVSKTTCARPTMRGSSAPTVSNDLCV